LKRIGFGATGSVYAAQGKQGTVALKFLHPHLSEDVELVKRFRIEAAVTQKLEVPQVVKTLDFGMAEDGSYYMVMEFVSGTSLSALLRHEKPPLEDAIEITRQVLQALDVAHMHRIIHRDLKPSNIILTTDKDGSPLVKILDFGFAKCLLEQHHQIYKDIKVTRGRIMMGTPHYMSPEQAQASQGIDGRADLYSLGVILYQMVTGVVPFDAKNQMDIVLKHIHEEPIPPIERDPSVPKPLSEYIMKLLAKDRGKRFGTAGEALSALNAMFPSTSGQLVEPVSAPATRPTMFFQELDRLVQQAPLPEEKKKSKTWVYLVAVLAGLIVVAVVIFALK
jgi:serine/threonine-protein kinase